MRGKAGQGADLAHQGAARSSGTARPRRCGSRTRASSSSASRSPTCRPSRSPTRRSSARRGFLFPGIALQERTRRRLSMCPIYIALVADLRPDGLRTGTTPSRASSARPNGASASTMASTASAIAGINQEDPGAFDFGTVDAGTPDDPNKLRGMIGTKGDFAINPRWDFGWDILVQSDKNFSYTYGIDGYSDYVQRSEVYLTGLDDRNYFDLQGDAFPGPGGRSRRATRRRATTSSLGCCRLSTIPTRPTSRSSAANSISTSMPGSSTARDARRFPGAFPVRSAASRAPTAG